MIWLIAFWLCLCILIMFCTFFPALRSWVCGLWRHPGHLSAQLVPMSTRPMSTRTHVNSYPCQLVPPTVDIYYHTIDVNSYHHLILALLGTSWHHLWYELTSLVVRVDICWWYEVTWVRVDMGTSWHGYELTGIHLGNPRGYFFIFHKHTIYIYRGANVPFLTFEWPIFYTYVSPPK